MESIELLTEAILNTLKDFSTEKRALTQEALRKALSTRKDVTSLLSTDLNAPSNNSRHETSVPHSGPKRIPLHKSGNPIDPNDQYIRTLRNAFLKILASLGPMLKDDFVNQSRDLSDEIGACQSLGALGVLGDRISDLVTSIINKAIQKLDFSDDFLAELNKDLSKMEEQLFSCQTYTRESYTLSNEFHNNLLSHTEDINRAFDSSKNIDDTQSLITSKLSMLTKAIEIKRQTDEVRLLEADTQIAELQKNIKTYSQEITQVRERADALEKEVLLDGLTQINNRRAYDLQIRENMRRFHRDGEPFSLVLIDIDHFKRVNDKYGHRAGDKCLQEIAKLIQNSLRKTDFFARYGGEELIAVLHGTYVEDAQNVAEKIRTRIEKTRFYFQEDLIPITISLGVTEVMATDTDADVTFIRADEAMYQAKQAGRNRVQVVTNLALCKIAGTR